MQGCQLTTPLAAEHLIMERDTSSNEHPTLLLPRYLSIIFAALLKIQSRDKEFDSHCTLVESALFVLATLNVNESFFLPLSHFVFSRRFHSFVYPERPIVPASSFVSSRCPLGIAETGCSTTRNQFVRGVVTPIVDSATERSFRFAFPRTADPLWIGRL